MPTFDEIIDDKKTYPDDTKVVIAEGVEVPLGQLRAGVLKARDYTHKTQTLARERAEFEQYKAQTTLALQDAEQRLMELAAKAVQANPTAPAEQVLAELDDDPRVRALTERIGKLEEVLKPMAAALVELDQRHRASVMEHMADQHRRVLAYLKSKDPDLNEQELIEFAKNRYIPRLDDAYRLYRYEDDLKKARAEAKEEGYKAGYEKGKAEAVAFPAVPLRATRKTPEEAPKTLDEAMAAALRDPDVMNPLLGIPRE